MPKGAAEAREGVHSSQLLSERLLREWVNCSGVMRSGNRSNTSFMAFTALQWGSEKMLTGVSQEVSFRLVAFQNVFDLNILNSSENVRMESINYCM